MYDLPPKAAEDAKKKVLDILRSHAPNIKFKVNVFLKGSFRSMGVEISYNADTITETGTKLKRAAIRKDVKSALQVVPFDDITVYFDAKKPPVVKVNNTAVNNIVNVAHGSNNDAIAVLKELTNNLTASDRKVKALLAEVLKKL